METGFGEDSDQRGLGKDGAKDLAGRTTKVFPAGT